MRILFLGDIVGRAGRQAVIDRLPDLRRSFALDVVIVNGENAASGFGITKKIADQLFAVGVDVITGGNHSWDQREALAFIDGEPRLLRPANFPLGTPGRSHHVYSLTDGRKILVINLMAQLFMEDLDNPFQAIEGILKTQRLGTTVEAIVLDFHGEATSEKMAMGHHVDGRVSLCVGTHTHVPTADHVILPGGTAYQSDAGMCGDYDSVIGMVKGPAVERFRRKMRGERLSPAMGEATLSGLLLQTDDKTGRAVTIEPLRLGGRLAEAMPRPEAFGVKPR